jgi:hypothetical protein
MEFSPRSKKRRVITVVTDLNAEDKADEIYKSITPATLQKIRNGEGIEINIPKNAPKDKGKSPFGGKPS